MEQWEVELVAVGGGSEFGSTSKLSRDQIRKQLRDWDLGAGGGDAAFGTGRSEWERERDQGRGSGERVFLLFPGELLRV